MLPPIILQPRSQLLLPRNNGQWLMPKPPMSIILASQGDGNDGLIQNADGFTLGPNGEFSMAFYVYPLNGGTNYTIWSCSAGVGA